MYELENDQEDATLDLGSGAMLIGGLDIVDLSGLGSLIDKLDEQGIQQFEIDTTN